MKTARKDVKIFYVMFWGVQAILILLGAHLILWHGEPEGFWDIFTLKGFLRQYVIHVVAFFVLAGVLELLHHWEFRKGEKEWLIPRHYAFYAMKTILLPICLAVPFGYFYFHSFGLTFDGWKYAQRVLPFYVIIVFLLNLIVFIRKLLIRMVWYLTNKAGQVEPVGGNVEEKEAGISKGGSGEIMTLELFFARDRMDIAISELVYGCIDNRSTMVYLRNGKVGRFHGTLTKLKEHIGDDPDFFVTGQWVVHGRYVDKIEDTFSRKKLIKLEFPFEARLSLPKEKVSEFKRWLQSVRTREGRS